MAVLTAQGISSLAIELLTRTLVLPMTASRIPGAEFSGSNGDTITVRVPQPSTARTQSSPGATITYDDVDEVPVDVSLSHLYHAKLVSDQELSLDLADFGRQITRVQVAAVATGAENQMATVMNGLPADLTIDADGGNIDAIVLQAREMLGRAEAPLDGRYLAVSPEVATFILALDEVSRVDASGDTNALRNAIIARWRGFNVVESTGLDAGKAVAYHRSGFAFANRVPVVPRGVTSSATAQSGGVGMRQIFQYVPDKLSDASVISTFAGAAVVTDAESGETTPRVVVMDTAES
ncbi:phage capsid protein [Solwaraspora sp. WMMD792]|uniref:phage capsid protein n=1 Tax=Solwaraspora sp. WMMD792 TaxID=3016099 RepID=UPI002417ECF2|nr:phage capsid protein [Solwaraspora sp. WMMD792]MDG4769008.1 phage capsid protein [Solwaraspora sp. WMMD792]